MARVVTEQEYRDHRMRGDCDGMLSYTVDAQGKNPRYESRACSTCGPYNAQLVVRMMAERGSDKKQSADRVVR